MSTVFPIGSQIGGIEPRGGGLPRLGLAFPPANQPLQQPIREFDIIAHRLMPFIIVSYYSISAINRGG